MAWMRANVTPDRSANELRDMLTGELGRFRGETSLTDDQAFLLLSEERVVGTALPVHIGKRRIPFQRGSFLFPVHT
jgi:hypothetical protein